MLFSELMKKLASGEPLDTAEQKELYLKARELETLEAIFSNLIITGTNTVKLDGAIIAGGDVVLDKDGIFIKNNQSAALTFGDPTNIRGLLYIVSDLSGFLSMVSNYITGGIKQIMKFAAGGTAYTKLYEDPAQSDRVLYEIVTTGAQGARFTVGQGLIDFRTEGSSGGSTFMRMRETATVPPAGGTDAYHMYMKGDKLIVQFNASGTAHYFYLDLTATTDQHWVYSATAP